MGIKIFYLSAIIYAVISSIGVLRLHLPGYFLYVLPAAIALFYLFYTSQKKVELVHTTIGAILVNLSVQLTGGLNSPLFMAYAIIVPIIGYKEKYSNYWIIAFCLLAVETLASVFSHEIMILRLVLFAAVIIIIGVLIKNYSENEAFLKKSLIKYEARDDVFRPADFESKEILTSLEDIDRHSGV